MGTEIVHEPGQPYDLNSLEDDFYGIDPSIKAELKDMILESTEGKIRLSHLRLRQLALDLAQTFEKSNRLIVGDLGTEEGVVVMFSDTLIKKITNILRAAAKADD